MDLLIAPPSQEREPPANPGRFNNSDPSGLEPEVGDTWIGEWMGWYQDPVDGAYARTVISAPVVIKGVWPMFTGASEGFLGLFTGLDYPSNAAEGGGSGGTATKAQANSGAKKEDKAKYEKRQCSKNSPEAQKYKDWINVGTDMQAKGLAFAAAGLAQQGAGAFFKQPQLIASGTTTEVGGQWLAYYGTYLQAAGSAGLLAHGSPREASSTLGNAYIDRYLGWAGGASGFFGDAPSKGVEALASLFPDCLW